MSSHPFFELARPIVLGHRGCAGEAPENTLPSFARALRTGATIIETDVRLTRDGIPVLIHDPTVDRTTNAAGEVRQMTFAEIGQLDAGHRFSPDSGRSHPFRGCDVRIPSLEQALAAFPGTRFNLELKDDSRELVARTLETVRTAGRESLTLVTAEDDATMVEIRRWIARLDSRVAQGASAGDVRAFVQSLLEGEAPPAGPQALQVPTEFAGNRFVTPEFVGHAHAHGIQVHVWTVDEPAEMHAWLDLGVDGLVTDFPARLAATIAERRSPDRS